MAEDNRGCGLWSGECAAGALTIDDKGLVFGATVLAPMRESADGAPVLAIDDAEARILALLSAAYRKSVGAEILDSIRRAAKYWRGGEPHLAAIELALSGL